MQFTYDEKIELAKNNIMEWYSAFKGKVLISYSGGKDSTVMMHLIRSLYPDVLAVFCNTGVEYPEVVTFVKKQQNVKIIRPAVSFRKVIEKYGYPVISKVISKNIRDFTRTASIYTRQRAFSKLAKSGSRIPVKYQYLVEAPFKISDKCCIHIKENPFLKLHKQSGMKPYIGIKADESRNRSFSQKKFGCNAFTMVNPQSRPIMSWNDDDVWKYIKDNKIEYCSLYDKGSDRTGCMFCCYGIQVEKSPNRFERMKITHPKHYKYAMDRLGIKKVLDYMDVPY